MTTRRYRGLLIFVAIVIALSVLSPHKYLPEETQQHIWSLFGPQPKPSTSTAEESPSPGLGGQAYPETGQEASDDAISRQSLWNEIYSVFNAHVPAYLDNMTWPSEWPTMPIFQMNKTYDPEEVRKLSPTMDPDKVEEAREAQAALEIAIPKWSKYKNLYSRRGYVMTTGSDFLNRVFPIGIQMLHRLGSQLPIEIWTKDQEEYDITYPVVQQLIAEFGIEMTCHRFSDYVDITKFPDNYLQYYLMKALTLVLTSFEEVIMLDADNVPMMSPEPLFTSSEYTSTGLILWPDFWSNSLSSPLHTILSIPFSFQRTCESGQLVVDKRKHFESLILAAYFNWYGDRYYQLITLDGMGAGDKDTFVVGAQALARPFHFTPRPVELMRAIHQNGSQWKEDKSVFNGAMGQFNPLNLSEVMFMHMHSPKLNFQLQNHVSTDLVFVRTDAENVHFSPNATYLEKLLWESIVWVECRSVLKVEKDPKDICGKASKRLFELKEVTGIQ